MNDSSLHPRVDVAASPVETFATTAPDRVECPAVLRRPSTGDVGRVVVLLHGGLDPLPQDVLGAIAVRSLMANHFLTAGATIVLPTRRARPDRARPSGAVADTLAIVEAATRLLGLDARPRDLVLFGSSGGGDLALEAAGELDPLAIVLEEPATSLLTGILDAETPKRGETWTPSEVWPHDYARHYTPARREATRRVLSRISCGVLIAQGDQRVEGVDATRPLDAVLVPELEALGKRVERCRFPGQHHGFGLLTGVAPGPVPRGSAEAVARFFDAAERFIKVERTTRR